MSLGLNIYYFISKTHWKWNQWGKMRQHSCQFFFLSSFLHISQCIYLPRGFFSVTVPHLTCIQILSWRVKCRVATGKYIPFEYQVVWEARSLQGPLLILLVPTKRITYLEVTDSLVVRAGVSVTWTVLSWSGGHEFEPRSGWTWGV